MAKLSGVPENFKGEITINSVDRTKFSVSLNGDGLEMTSIVDLKNGIIHNRLIVITDSKKYDGSTILEKQVNQAANGGFKKITAYAAKEGGMNGYYTWPRLGYQPTEQPKTQINAYNMTYDAKAISLFDMMATPEGREYWKKRGVDGNAEFDLTDGSQSRTTLTNYNNKKFSRT